jgi:hypothetical protein
MISFQRYWVLSHDFLVVLKTLSDLFSIGANIFNKTTKVFCVKITYMSSMLSFVKNIGF